MNRVAARLREEGVAVATLDLTGIGQHLTPEQWYDGLLLQLGRKLDLEEELEDYWREHERLGPLQRWMAALQEVVLRHRPGRVVIFIDEIDAVQSLPFSADEFFAAIRECYTRRAEDAEYHRLTFCLIGVASPTDLIQDTRLTPFNIGRRIELTDFSEREAAPMAKGLGRDDPSSEALLKQILYWTGGHPYLTQRLCQAVGEDEKVTVPAGADRHVEALFLSAAAREKDDNLLFVRDRLLRNDVDRASLLDLYGKVRTGKRVSPDDTNPLLDLLRLSGITRLAGNRLVVRNRIYERVFDREWVTQHMPDAELRRQKAAFRRGVLRAAGVAAAVVAVMAVLVVIAVSKTRIAEEALVRADINAERLKLRSEQRERTLRETRQLLYLSDMNVAYQGGKISTSGARCNCWTTIVPNPARTTCGASSGITFGGSVTATCSPSRGIRVRSFSSRSLLTARP